MFAAVRPTGSGGIWRQLPFAFCPLGKRHGGELPQGLKGSSRKSTCLRLQAVLCQKWTPISIKSALATSKIYVSSVCFTQDSLKHGAQGRGHSCLGLKSVLPISALTLSTKTILLKRNWAILYLCSKLLEDSISSRVETKSLLWPEQPHVTWPLLSLWLHLLLSPPSVLWALPSVLFLKYTEDGCVQGFAHASL